MTEETAAGAHPTIARIPANFLRSAVTGYAATVWSGLVSIAVTPLLVHHLGKERYGIWTLATAIALYLELLEFGFGGATVKAVAEASARRSLRAMSEAVSTSFVVLSGFGLIALVAGAIFAAFFPTIFSVSPSELALTSTVVMALVAVDVAVSVPMDTFGGGLMGVQRLDLVNATLAATTTLQAVSWVVIIQLGGGLVPLVVATVGWSLAGQVSRYFMLRRAVPGLVVSRKYVRRSLASTLSRQSGWFALADVSVMVAVRADVIIVALLVGVPAAAVYGVAQKLVFALERFVYPVSVAFFAHFSSLAARNDLASVRGSLVAGTRAALAVSAPLALTLAVLAQPLLEAWVGPGFDTAATLLAFLLSYAVVVAATGPSQRMLQGIGRASNTGLFLGLEAVLNLGLSVALGLRWGIVGVGAASLIAGVIARLGILVPYACRIVGGRVWVALLRVVADHVLPAASALAVGVFLDRHRDSYGPDLLIAVPAVLFTYLGVLAVTGLSGAERRLIVRRVRAQFG